MAVRHPRALALATALAVVVTAPAHARQETLLQASYEAAVVALQTEGDAAPAHRLAAAWTHRQFEIAAARTRWESPRLARPASLLHLELALAAVETDPDEALWQIRLGDHLLELVARAQPVPADDFVARWSVVASSVFLARTDPPRARAALAFGLISGLATRWCVSRPAPSKTSRRCWRKTTTPGLADRKGTDGPAPDLSPHGDRRAGVSRGAGALGRATRRRGFASVGSCIGAIGSRRRARNSSGHAPPCYHG